MVNRLEILEHAGELTLRPNVVEKDYVLGWLLAGIGQHASLANSWVFKGGTCLKKCYFETYRFSEDLDFTLLDASHLEENFLRTVFEEIGAWVYEASGIEIPKEGLRFNLYQNPQGKPSVEGRASYRGPIAPGGDLPRIKLDLTNDEIVSATPVMRKIYHDYSDAGGYHFAIRCYPYEEVFAEKIRALKQRGLPRDLYDIIHLYRHPEIKPDREAVCSILRQKCEFKKMEIPTLQSIEPQKEELLREWSIMLTHQLPSLPPFEEFWNELPKVFEWVESGIVSPALQSIGSGSENIDPTWTPPPAAHAWGINAPLEQIRFAASNRLCVNLGYDGTTRLIEPYSLRRSQEGKLLLFALHVDDRAVRSYRVDRIQSAEITQRVFIPAYIVELTSTGPIHAPTHSRTASSPKKLGGIASVGYGTSSHSSRKFVIQCTQCGKQFARSTRDTALREHKTKNGYPCRGRRGFFVRMK